jgi:Protein of unknown function (DUF2892)
MVFAKFMATSFGRTIRILAGIALIAAGVYLGGTWGIVLAVVGAVPLLAGAFNVCGIAPLLGVPFSGSRVRTQA